MLKEILEKLNESASDNIIVAISNGNIPISPKTMERILGENKMNYLHVLEVEDVKKLEKLQHTRKTVSCFNKWGNKSIFEYGADGMELGAPAIALLNGKAAIHQKDDIFTDLDWQGRRWIDADAIEDDELLEFWTSIKDEILTKIMKWFEKNYNCDKPLGYILNGLKVGEWDCDFDVKMFKKDLISNYIDITEKILKKYKKQILSFMKYESVERYNEILGYDFEIKEIAIVADNIYQNSMLNNEEEEIISEDQDYYINVIDRNSETFKILENAFKREFPNLNIYVAEDIDDLANHCKKFVKGK